MQAKVKSVKIFNRKLSFFDKLSDFQCPLNKTIINHLLSYQISISAAMWLKRKILFFSFLFAASDLSFFLTCSRQETKYQKNGKKKILCSVYFIRVSANKKNNLKWSLWYFNVVMAFF